MKTKGWISLAAAGLGMVCAIAPAGAAPPTIDSYTFGALRARDIGPAKMSGRIAAIDGVPGDPEGRRPTTLWVGAASGGVWKSDDAGTTFEPVFDEHPQSIGAIRVDPSDPDVVWVGTGETWVRNSVSVGAGVFKTTDGGESWKSMGLEASERIGAIRIDPTNGDVVYVCATGALWNANEERGVYKTTDGGETWEAILQLDADTGCADLDIDPQDPSILYAALWQFRRSPDYFESGGPGSGLYKTSDGGATWKRLETGLPSGELGRIAVAVSPSRPSVVYATVESKKTALYRSDDVGETWSEKNSSPNVVMRPFYFSELMVDPSDFRRVYKPGFVLTSSVDGGESFTSMMGGFGGSVHPDHHALWIDPSNPSTLVLGTDGGVYISYDGSNSWRFVGSLPVSQLYHVSYDMEHPYNVYGGLQDNGSWRGPSQSPGGVQNSDWENIGFGDGFWAFPHPDDSNTLYVEYQGGRLLRLDRRTGELQRIAPYPEEGQEKLRFNWNTPIHLSPNESETLYVGSQYLHRSRDRGTSWETVSPDLTTDDPALQRQASSGGLTIDNTTAENHATIFSIAESPLDPAVIWVGTDDGNLQLTRDGGATWSEVSDNVEGVPDRTWVSRVEASPHAAGTAFVTFDGHQTGDMATYVAKTEDYGLSWVSLVTEEIEGFAKVIEQDPVNPDLLFLGTEAGLFVSLDGGTIWARFKENLPQVAVHDLAIHPREHDLIIATHGRGVYIVDDITPLRNLTPEILDAEVALVPSKPSVVLPDIQLQEFPADDEFVGDNPPRAASVTYYLKKRHMFGDLKLEIYDPAGNLLRTLPGGKRRGLNRIDWPMRLEPPKLPAATSLVPAFIGPRVKEGTYTVKLIKGKTTVEGTIELVADETSPHTAEDRAIQLETTLALYHGLADLTYAMDSLVDLRDATRARAEGLKQGDVAKLEAFAQRLDDLRSTLVSTAASGMLSGDEKLREEMGNLYGDISAYDGRPTDSQRAEKDRLLTRLAEAVAKIDAAVAEDLPALNRLLEKRGKEPLARQSYEAWEDGDTVGSGSGSVVSSRARRRWMEWAETGLMILR